MKPSIDMRSIIAKTVLKEHDHDYSIVMLSVNDKEKAKEMMIFLDPYYSITFTKEEISIVLKSDDWCCLKQKFDNFREQGPYRLITFDIELDLSLVGYLSLISSILSDVGVSIFVISTYLKDHILVKKEQKGKTLKVLHEFINKAKDTT
jgi:hypothetical protein